MDRPASVQPIVVYLIQEHPLEVNRSGGRFEWLGPDDRVRANLQTLIGPHDAEDVTMLVDKHPAGPAWRQLLRALLEERVRMVVTHLAPLSSAQRQLLIGVCAQVGSQLITPGDAGRNRNGEVETVGI